MKKFLLFTLFCISFLITFSVLANPIAIIEYSDSIKREPITEFFWENPNFLLAMHMSIYLLLTGIAETIVFWSFKYRGWKNLTYIFATNLVPNFAAYICFCNYNFSLNDAFHILLMEVLVLLFECISLGIVLKYDKKTPFNTFYC